MSRLVRLRKQIAGQEETLALLLTDREAKILRSLLGKCSGGGPTSEIFNALAEEFPNPEFEVRTNGSVLSIIHVVDKSE